VRKIEAWYTSNGGQTWQRAAKTPAPQPIEFDLPAKAFFGRQLAVNNNAGYGGLPPANGDQPDWWLEVDLDAAAVKLLGVRPGNDPANPAPTSFPGAPGQESRADAHLGVLLGINWARGRPSHKANSQPRAPTLDVARAVPRVIFLAWKHRPGRQRRPIAK